MPNYCQNILRIKGNPRQLAKFRKKYCNKDLDIDFNFIVPQPKTKRELLKKYPSFYVENSHTFWGENHSETWIERHFDWYNWCIKFWGTKWNAMDCNMTKPHEDIIEFRFDTAWNPPIPVIEKLVELEPKLNITLLYYEAGCGLAGHWINGFDVGYQGDLDEWAIKQEFEDRF